jgi:hypothetical protein
MVKADGSKPSESGIARQDTNKTDCCRVFESSRSRSNQNDRTCTLVLEREFEQALSVPSGGRRLDFQKLALFA